MVIYLMFQTLNFIVIMKKMARIVKKDIQKSKKTRKATAKKTTKKKLYSETALKEALVAIEKGDSFRKVSEVYKIPVTTLHRKSKNDDCILKKSGPEPILSKEVEQNIVNWIIYRAERGHPVGKNDILDGVQRYVINSGITTPFINGRPGRHWYQAFLKRHGTILATRTAQNLSFDRANVTEDDLREWFESIKNHLTKKNLLNIHPSRVYNCDETSVQLCPKPNKVVAAKGARSIYKVVDADEKEALTTLFMYSAEGVLAPPMCMYPYKEKVPKNIIENCPSDWAVGISENGWMTIESFYEYITNVFYAWLVKQQIEFPVILYLDGHSSHITIPLVLFCLEKMIELCPLFPHSTHIMQPLDTSFFHPLKEIWKRIVPEWKVENNKTRLTKQDFGKVLKLAIDSFPGAKNAVQNGFRATGLMPFNPEAVDYRVLDKRKRTKTVNTVAETSTGSAADSFLTIFEKKLPAGLLEEFQKYSESGSWKGDISKTGLFEYWLRIKAEASGFEVQKPVEVQNNVTAITNLYDSLSQDTECSNECDRLSNNCDCLENEILLLNNEKILNSCVNTSFERDYSIVIEPKPSAFDICSSYRNVLNYTIEDEEESAVIEVSEVSDVAILQLLDNTEIVSNDSSAQDPNSNSDNLKPQVQVIINNDSINFEENNDIFQMDNKENDRVCNILHCNLPNDNILKPQVMNITNDNTCQDRNSEADINLDISNSNVKKEIFEKSFTLPIKYLPKKKRDKLMKDGKEKVKLPVVATSEEWLKIQLQKEKKKDEEEEKRSERKLIQKEKKKMSEEMKILQEKKKLMKKEVEAKIAEEMRILEGKFQNIPKKTKKDKN